MWIVYYGGFSDFFMGYKCVFDFGGVYLVVGYVDYVIYMVCDLVIVVFILMIVVFGEVVVFVVREVGFFELFMIVLNCVYLVGLVVMDVKYVFYVIVFDDFIRGWF